MYNCVYLNSFRKRQYKPIQRSLAIHVSAYDNYKLTENDNYHSWVHVELRLKSAFVSLRFVSQTTVSHGNQHLEIRTWGNEVNSYDNLVALRSIRISVMNKQNS